MGNAKREHLAARIRNSSALSRTSTRKTWGGVAGRDQSLQQAVKDASKPRSFPGVITRFSSTQPGFSLSSAQPDVVRRLYITDISKTASMESVKLIFVKHGKCHMELSYNKEHDCKSGFVTYKTADGVQNALAKKDSFKVQGKKIIVTKARSMMKQLFVGGYGPELTESQFNDFFSQYGEVCRIDMKRTTDGRSRCFGFVTFRDSPDAVEHLTKVRFVECHDKIMEITIAREKTRTNDSTSSYRPSTNASKDSDLELSFNEYPGSRNRDTTQSLSSASSRFFRESLNDRFSRSSQRSSTSSTSSTSSLYQKKYFAPLRNTNGTTMQNLA